MTSAVSSSSTAAVSGSSALVVPQYGPSASETAYRRVLRQSVAAICKTAAFEAIDGHVLELLTHMIASFVSESCRASKAMCEHAGRTQPTPSDVLTALVDMGVDIAALPEYMQQFSLTGSIVIAPPRPQPPSNPPQSLRIGVSRPHPAHIPDWLPPFPDPHTYIRSEISGEPETSYEKVRELSSAQKRSVDNALIDLMLRLHPTIPLFREYEEKVRREAKEKLVELERQRRERQEAEKDEDLNGETEENEDDGLPPVKRSRLMSGFNWDETGDLLETEQSLLAEKIPGYCRILEPTLENRPYMLALITDEAAEEESVIVAAGTAIPKAEGDNAIAEENQDNPFFKPPRLPPVGER